jgi:Lon protease-like protein
MDRPNRIPLFPLNVVLLPGTILPLHIFEPRYKAMIAECLRDEREFGMVLASNTSMAAVGCTAEIVQKLKEYPDGRMDILTEGRAAFHLAQLLDEKEYYEGVVEYLTDEPSRIDIAMQVQLTDIFEKCHLLPSGRPRAKDEPCEPGTFSYRIAALLPVELEKKQTLLEMRSESERRKVLLVWMSAFLEELLERQRTRQRMGGNGHPPN